MRDSLLRRTITLILWAGLSLTSAWVWAAEPEKIVLAIYSNRNNLASNAVVDETIRSVLSAASDMSIDLRSEYVNNTAELSKETSLALRDFLRSKYASERLHAVLTVGNDALLFVSGYGQELFPGVPVISWGSRDVVERWGDGPPITGVLEPEPIHQIEVELEFILRLQPGVRQVVVVSGAAEFDRLREIAARQALRGFEERIKATYLSGLPLEDVQQRLSNLPMGSAVLFLTMGRDGAGKRLVTRDVIAKLTPTTNAPVYALSAIHLGTGIVGGFVLDQQNMARDAAEITLQILRGEKISRIPVRDSRAVYQADSQVLQRWDLNEHRLPPGTVVLNKEASLWSQYKWHIIAVISVCLIEMLLICALLIQQAKRKRAEKEAARSRELLQATIDSLDAHIALMDENANITAVNESWRRFAKTQGYATDDHGVGRNYLQFFEARAGINEAGVVQEALQALMRGESSSFCRVYDCSYGSNERWFQLKANRFLCQGILRLALAHEDITDIKRAHDIQQKHSGLLLQAQDEERRRIARDLHDVTVQNLATIKANLIRVQGKLKDDARMDEPLRESVAFCDQVIRELRTLSYLLHPPLLDEAGLVPALRWYVRGFVERCGIEVEVLVTGDIGRLPSDTETALFRIVQECLTNIHRHSGCHSAVIWVTKDEDEIVVRIQDDGHGMRERTVDGSTLAHKPGVGILGMQQRLRQLGGRLEIESDSLGTTVTARAPVPKEDCVAHSCG